MKIIDIQAIQILDSRGNPTLSVDVILDDGSKGNFQVPSGASTGIHEAHELRDKGKSFGGNSVYTAIDNIYSIKDELINKELEQIQLDELLIKLDGTENKEKLGANAILGISIAFAKASAKYYNLPLYKYLYKLANNNQNFQELTQIHLFANIINGGLHAGNDLQVQEFMILPTSGNLQEKIQMICEIYQILKKLIGEKYGKSNTAVGDEGGFAPNISTPIEALELLNEAVKISGYEGKISYALDAAASDFYNTETKLYEIELGNKLDYKQLTAYYQNLIEKYPLISIEDPISEDDFDGFEYYMKNIKNLNNTNPLNNSDKSLCVGDDLLVTNPQRINLAIQKKLCNSLLLKINQIGTLTESIQAHNLAKAQGWHTIVSHRSGETIDDFISDLAVALESSIKLGAPARGERVAKYNRLLDIFK